MTYDIRIYEVCKEIYERHGRGGVMDFVSQYYPNMPVAFCFPCDTDSYFENRHCLACGEKQGPWPREQHFFEVYFTRHCRVGMYATSIDEAVQKFNDGLTPDWPELHGSPRGVSADIQDDPARVGWSL